MLEAYSLRYWFVLLAALALLHLGTQLALIVVRLIVNKKMEGKNVKKNKKYDYYCHVALFVHLGLKFGRCAFVYDDVFKGVR